LPQGLPNLLLSANNQLFIKELFFLYSSKSITMKKNIPQLVSIIILCLSFMAFANAENDTITMGQGYSNDVYYSMENGIVKVEPRNNWDLAFYTLRWSAGISINDGIGAELYTYPLDDTSGWNTIDVSAIDSWTPLYNSDTIWEDGAFNRKSLGHPDYGWGVYNMVTHDVVGDSIYILKRPNAPLKKLWIERKNSVSNTYYFRYANIDGSDEILEVLDVNPYTDKMFVYYNIANQEVVDREPLMTEWDLVFSRYIGTVFDNDGNPASYLVVGVLNNLETGANKFQDVEENFEDFTAAPMLFERSPIGSDWKSFNMGSFAWEIEDNHAYFVQIQTGDVYKLVFDYFSGTGTGRVGFSKKLISLADVPEASHETRHFSIFPNPAQQTLSLGISATQALDAHLTIYDMLGRQVLDQKLNAGTTLHKIDLQNFNNGVYIVVMQLDGVRHSQRLIVNN
jgi:hypothetical protein